MIIIGTGGHALDLLSDGFLFRQHNPLYFYDSVNTNESTIIFGSYRVFNSLMELDHLAQSEKKFILAVGNPQTRQTLYEDFERAGMIPTTYTSPLALLAQNSSIGLGSNIMPFASIFGHASVGKGTLVNSYASIHHGAEIGEFCEISPGTRLLGNIRIGNKVQLGANAIVLPGVTIGHNSIIGAGSVVTVDLPDYCTAVGVPAKIIKIR